MEVKKRKVYIDILRIIACFFVIFNHFDNGFYNFLHLRPGSLSYWIFLATSIFCKFAVPLFFMISGCLLLNKDEDIYTLYKKRIFRIIKTLIIASVIYYFSERLLVGVRHDFSEIYTGNMLYHLWYLYAYIAFLMILPFLRSIVKNLNNDGYLYLIILNLAITAFLPVLEFLLGGNQTRINGFLTYTPVAMNIFCYPLIGYYIDKKIDVTKISRRYMYLMWAINVAFILTSAYCTYILAGMDVVDGGDVQKYMPLFSIYNAICIFVTVKRSKRLNEINDKKSSLIVKIGAATFGIYILHMIIVRPVILNSNIAKLYTDLNVVAQYGVWWLFSAIVFSSCCAIVWFIGKIPVLRRMF